jgi:hypothetical protein
MQYQVNSADQEVLPNAVFSILPLPRHSQAQISPSLPYYQTSSAYVPPSVWETKIHTHIKKQAKL